VVQPRSCLYCALNRHYVTPDLARAMQAMGRDLADAYPGLKVVYLDANFPFVDDFPLLPHLSHDDGRKLDLAFFYRDSAGAPSGFATPSPIGYWGYEQPRPRDPQPCADWAGGVTMRWDFDWLQTQLPDRDLHEAATAAMLRWLSVEGPKHGVEKVLLEPHLSKRLGVWHNMIRFAGCRAARHDDHVHLQVR